MENTQIQYHRLLGLCEKIQLPRLIKYSGISKTTTEYLPSAITFTAQSVSRCNLTTADVHSGASVLLRKLQSVTAFTSTSDTDKMCDREKEILTVKRGSLPEMVVGDRPASVDGRHHGWSKSLLGDGERERLRLRAAS